MQRVIEYTLPQAGPEDDETLTVLRLTIGPMSALQLARYRAELRRVNEWLKVECGYDLFDPESWDDVALDMIGMARQSAYMRHAVQRVETGICAPDGEPETWEPGQLPEAWQSVGSFMEHIPAVLWVVWEEAANAVHGGMFGAVNDEKKRQPGSVTAR